RSLHSPPYRSSSTPPRCPKNVCPTSRTRGYTFAVSRRLHAVSLKAACHRHHDRTARSNDLVLPCTSLSPPDAHFPRARVPPIRHRVESQGGQS
ncbi:MAG: hypothetical protein M1823_008949, partial [Watsoniomyces obsoletus]